MSCSIAVVVQAATAPPLHLHHHLAHMVVLWGWFLLCALAYVGKRAFYQLRGENRVASSLKGYIGVAGVPVAFRLLVDSLVYWVCFTPQILQAGLQFMGWQSAAGVVDVITRFAPCAGMFGLCVDPMMDWAIPTVFAKIPFLKDFWPQMPGPMSTTKNAPSGGGN